MSSEDVAILTLWIQAAAVVAAVAAAIIALTVSAKDRANSRHIAAADREAARTLTTTDRVDALRHAQLLFEQNVLLRLLENARHGGSTDDLKRADLGAEAAALIGIIGPERLPLNWDNRVHADESEMQAKLENSDGETPPFVKHQIEVQLELNRVTREIHQMMQEPSVG